MKEMTFEAGHAFFRVGDPSDYAYDLIEGQVELYAGANGDVVLIAGLGPGDVFGEMALIEERPRAMTAKAVEGGRAVVMDRDEFERLLLQDPGRARRYLRSLFERLRSLSMRAGTDREDSTQGESLGSQPLREFPVSHGAASAWIIDVMPLTSKAAETLPEEGASVAKFPFRIGRVTGAREEDVLDLNDLWLLDEAPYNVSRNHCQIAADGRGVLVHDRGSHLGCGVNARWIGGQSRDRQARLKEGDNELVIGTAQSPYRYRVVVRRA